tara:strand:- start:309 stop:650 length:342 start_codon:yes stop_codon:yes gene_type:complete
MKKFLFLLLLIPLAGSAKMFPTEFEIKAVCWDNAEDAIQYHQEVLGEYPIGKGWVNNVNGPTFAAIMFNPVKPSWTFLNFHESTKGDIVVCAVTGGTMWDIINPGDEGERLEL